MEDSGEFGRVWGKINILRVKVWSLEATKQTHREQSSPNLRSFENFDVQSHRMEVLQIAVG